MHSVPENKFAPFVVIDNETLLPVEYFHNHVSAFDHVQKNGGVGVMIVMDNPRLDSPADFPTNPQVIIRALETGIISESENEKRFADAYKVLITSHYIWWLNARYRDTATDLVNNGLIVLP